MPQIRFDMPRRDCRLTCLLESRLGTPSSFSSCGRAQSRTRAASLCQSRLQRIQRVTHNVPEGYLVHYAARPEARHHYSANSNPQCFQKTNLSTTSATITQRGPHATQRILVRIAISSLVPHTRKTFCSLHCPDHLAGLARGVGCSLVYRSSIVCTFPLAHQDQNSNWYWPPHEHYSSDRCRQSQGKVQRGRRVG